MVIINAQAIFEWGFCVCLFWFFKYVNVRVSLCVSPVTSWWHVQDVPCFWPDDTWDRLQLFCDREMDKQKKMDGYYKHPMN